MDLSRRLLTFVAAVAAVASISFAAPSDADAFCGFYVSGAEANLYNNATMVSLMREGKRTVLSMQNNYEGPPEDFAMVVPVPVVLKKKQVKTLSDDVFARLDRLTAPRLVEYWERDPCQRPVYAEDEEAMLDDVGAAAPRQRTMAKKKGSVKVHAQFKVGEYDIVILSSTESTALEDWLNENNYNIPDGAAPYFKPYVQSGQYFFVAKVDVEKVKFEDGEAILSPIRFHYDSDDFVLPVRLGLINSKGAQDLIAFVLAKGQRYEVANYPNVTIPTNIGVNEDVKENFGGFYNELFRNVLKENPKAVVTEYSWATSTCDPCPGPPLTGKDLLTLGADVISGQQAAPDTPGQQPRSGISRPMPRPGAGGWVVTRLHARYDKHTLGKDLVFKAAPPIVGGRGMPQGEEGTLPEQGSQPGSVNNFQGRYALLHHWEGEVDCENPQRGMWGGPGGRGGAKAESAGNLAFSEPEADLALAKYVTDEQISGLTQPVAAYDEPVPALFQTTGEEPDDGEQGGGMEEPEAPEAPEAPEEPQTPRTTAERHPRGSGSGGCAGTGNAAKGSAALLGILLLIGGVRRRK